MDLMFNEKTQMWEEKKEPFATIEVETEEDFNRLYELVQADREGRCVVLPDAQYTDEDGETALRKAMSLCLVQNNPTTRYTVDAIAEKLAREAAIAKNAATTEEGKG